MKYINREEFLNNLNKSDRHIILKNNYMAILTQKQPKFIESFNSVIIRKSNEVSPMTFCNY